MAKDELAGGKGGSRGGPLPAIPPGAPVVVAPRVGPELPGDQAGGKGGSRGSGGPSPNPGSGK